MLSKYLPISTALACVIPPRHLYLCLLVRSSDPKITQNAPPPSFECPSLWWRGRQTGTLSQTGTQPAVSPSRKHTSCKPSNATLLAHLAHAAVPALGPLAPPPIPHPQAPPTAPPPPPPPPSPNRFDDSDAEEDSGDADPPPAACGAPPTPPPDGPAEALAVDDERSAISAASSLKLAVWRAVRREASRADSVRRARASAPGTSPFLSRR